jgi:hypothetical protein
VIAKKGDGGDEVRMTTPSGCLWRRWCPVQEGADMWGFLVCDIERNDTERTHDIAFYSKTSPGD